MEQLLQNTWIILALAVWIIPWKGVALWKAAHNEDKKWFIALLVINTLGLLEIAYIFYFDKRGSRGREHSSTASECQQNTEYFGKHTTETDEN